MQEGIVYLNGEYVEESQAKLSIFDRGFLFGDAAYDIGRTFDHKPYRWQEHIDRLFRSLKYVQIDPGLTPQEVYHITEEVLHRNLQILQPNDDFQIMWRVSRGEGMRWAEITRPTVLIHCQKIAFAAFARKYVDGSNLIIASTR